MKYSDERRESIRKKLLPAHILIVSEVAKEEEGILNAYRRWARGDENRRSEANRPLARHTLTPEEHQHVLDICHRPAFVSLPPGQIVTRLLDEEVRYVASESSYYRILREHGEQHHRGRARVPRPEGDPQRHRVTQPNGCWTWEITYLPSLVRGQFYCLYMIVDVFSRKIITAEVFEQESMANNSSVNQRVVLHEGCVNQPLVLHADNGSAMKGSTLQATLQRLNITPSYSRPQDSNDNAISESLLRTCKYRPNFPTDGYADLSAAQQWVVGFLQWYNHEHRHSAIRFVTPAERHAGQDLAVLAKRDEIYVEAKRKHPIRLSGSTRNWTPRKTAWLNPDAEDPVHQQNQQLEMA
ncbi:DDE-type integrase/transposase/recombinase [Halomonas vilamensis]|uniref:DDE-type integrase/transposase/recombinase n=1 Tax=Vreelandella vilamensis TaxID=531309 RepID=A0ABU1H3H2_9GAMM|nr:DDE-type integrase/transposase/recombinase [Halomonas vilamensis]MDR5898834.1 DDE-type integrase/transposase/recombinase [Halomonas vilamensis]